MNIQIKTIPHKEQRYETVGDWWFDKNGDIQIRVSKMYDIKDNDSWKYEALMYVHELIEVLLCKDRGITTEEVDKFDKQFNEEKKEGEAGDDPKSPYRNEHFFATNLERLMSKELGVDWKIYDNTIINLEKEKRNLNKLKK